MTGPIVRRLAARAAALGVVACAAAAPIGLHEFAPELAAAHHSASAADLALAASPQLPSDRPTHVKVASFNVLGADHHRKGYASGTTRMKKAASLIKHQGFDAVGFQEMQKPQLKVYRSELSKSYHSFPSAELGSAAMANSIAWDYSKWFAEKKKTIKMHYFRGHEIRMPYVLLRNRSTGAKMWIVNNHYPADTRGKNAKWRQKDAVLESNLVQRLVKNYPSDPVITTGDKNTRKAYFCPIEKRTSQVAANGGGMEKTKCRLPSRPKKVPVDWITGSSKVRWSTYEALNTKQVKSITDHRVPIATGVIPSSETVSQGVKHVVLINVSGLNAERYMKLSSAQLTHLKSLARHGAYALNARTTRESVGPIPNAVGMLTSRPVPRSISGHGVSSKKDHGGTIHSAAGHYVASVFDVLHDYGRKTAMWSSAPLSAKRIKLSYGNKFGRADYMGLGNGHNKITRSGITGSDAQTTKKAVADINKRPKAFEFVDLNGPDLAAQKHGSTSKQYTTALRKVDKYVGRITKAANSGKTKGNTVLIITSDHGGVATKKLTKDNRWAYTVPFIVWGHGVAQGANLYSLNPQYKNPGSKQPKYTAKRDPIRNSYAANLVTKLLRLPPVTGSNMDSGQTMTVSR